MKILSLLSAFVLIVFLATLIFNPTIKSKEESACKEKFPAGTFVKNRLGTVSMVIRSYFDSSRNKKYCYLVVRLKSGERSFWNEFELENIKGGDR